MTGLTRPVMANKLLSSMSFGVLEFWLRHICPLIVRTSRSLRSDVVLVKMPFWWRVNEPRKCQQICFVMSFLWTKEPSNAKNGWSGISRGRSGEKNISSDN